MSNNYYAEKGIELSEISHAIDAVWSFEYNHQDSLESYVFPDGSVDIIFQQSKGGMQATLCGVMNRTVKLEHHKGHKYYGIRLKPGYASAFFDVSIDGTLNKTLELNKYFLKQDELLDFLNYDNPDIASFEKVLHEQLLNKVDMQRLKELDKHIAVMQNVEHGTVSMLASNHQLSRRHFSRCFKEIYGLSPREYTNIQRLNAFRSMGETFGEISLIDLAFELGFVDQSHMNRCIKKLSGFTPKELLSQTYNT